MAGLDARVDLLFRRSAGRMVAALTRALGPHELDLAEEVVQDALVRALQTWPYQGVPDNPEGWLFRVARNRALDRLRARSTRQRHHDAMAGVGDVGPMAAPSAAGDLPLESLADDELVMIFMCCHPRIPADGRLALTLRTVGGFSTDEIARAFLTSRSTVQQRIVRAKRRIRDEGLVFSIPASAEWSERLESVLTVLYLVFNEGYGASRGDSVVRRDLCHEAIRLCGLLLDRPETAVPEAHALMALMLLQAARLPARTGASHALILLEDQDRSLWDGAMIARGLLALDRAAAGDRLTPYHLEAGIAAEHATAPSWAETDWPRIVTYYDRLLAVSASPVVALNRAVALAMVGGPDRGLSALDALEADGALDGYHLLPAVRAELLVRAGRAAEAAPHYARALELVGTVPERDFLERRRAEAGRMHGAR